MHGVAFNIDLHSGNTHKTDGVLYGKWPANATDAQKPDNAYLGNVYRAVNATVGRNGRKIRLITTSWGSQPSTENYSTLEPPAGGPATFGLNASVRYLTTPEGVADSDGNTSHWANGAMEAARSGTLIQFTAGNSGYVNPTARAALAYYYPDLEPTFYTTSGVNPGSMRTTNPDGSVLVPGVQSFNQCGVMKYSCVTAPGNGINSTWWLNNPLRPTYMQRLGHLDVRPALRGRARADPAAVPVHDQHAGAAHDVHDRAPERDDRQPGGPEPDAWPDRDDPGRPQRLGHGQPA